MENLVKTEKPGRRACGETRILYMHLEGTRLKIVAELPAIFTEFHTCFPLSFKTF